MRVFISWSGERSGKVATALQNWLPRVIQATSPWLSSTSIDPGSRWSDEVAAALEELQCGVLCLTPENITSPWILFETGALSKAVSKSRVIPYLLGFEPRELQGPLAQFQAVRADEQGTQALLHAINTAEEVPLLDPELLSEAFQLWWPRLDSVLNKIASSSPGEPTPPPRSLEDMMGETLELLRSAKLAQSVNYTSPSITKTFNADGSGGRRIRQLRIAQGMQQKALAYLSGYSLSFISRLETGRANASIEALAKLAEVLGVPLDYLIEPTFQPAEPTAMEEETDEGQEDSLQGNLRIKGGF